MNSESKFDSKSMLKGEWKVEEWIKVEQGMKV